MNEREGFEAAIREDRYDQVTRLAFADWLEEHDCPEEADFQRSWTPEWQKAKDDLLAYCKKIDINFTYFEEMAANHLEKGEGIDCTLNTSNLSMDEDMEEMWRNVGIYLRRDVPPDKAYDPFTCGGNCYPDGVSWEDGEDYEK